MAKRKRHAQGSTKNARISSSPTFIHVLIGNETGLEIIKRYSPIEIKSPLRLTDLVSSVMAGIEELAFAAHIEFVAPREIEHEQGCTCMECCNKEFGKLNA